MIVKKISINNVTTSVTKFFFDSETVDSIRKHTIELSSIREPEDASELLKNQRFA